MNFVRRASAFLQSIRFVRFGVIGVLSTAIYAIVVYLSVAVVAVPPSLASVIGYLVAIPFNFLGQRHYAFRSSGNPTIEIVLFVAVQLMNIAIAAVTMAVVTANGYSFLLGIGLVCIGIPVINYVLLKVIVFRLGASRSVSPPHDNA